MPACCRPRAEVQVHLRLHQFSACRHRRACRLNHHFDSFCGGLLLFAYVCSTGVFGAIFPADLRLAFVSSVRDSLDDGSVSPFFTGG